MFKKLSSEQQKELEPIMATIARFWLDEMEKELWSPWSKSNPLIIYPHNADQFNIGYKDFVPFEYKWTWYIVSWKLNP